MTTFAEKLKRTAAEKVMRDATKRNEEQKRVLKKALDEIRSSAEHAAKTGHLECEVELDVYENNDVHKNAVVPSLQRELTALGFSSKTLIWRYHDEKTERNEDGKHLYVRLSWEEPLSKDQVDAILLPAVSATATEHVK